MMKMSEQEFIEISEMIHEWKDIEGYEGIYRVSEYGDVMSIGYGKKKILKPRMNGYGYLIVDLYKNGKCNHYKVHRLVATAFCEGADYFPEVNHIDEDKTNNHYENLEWCTREYNNNYGTIKDRLAEAHKKKVRCVELDMEFDSLSDAAAYVGNSSSNISACLRGKQKKCAGYHWIYAN